MVARGGGGGAGGVLYGVAQFCMGCNTKCHKGQGSVKKGQKSITYFLNNSPRACLGQTIIDLPIVFF